MNAEQNTRAAIVLGSIRAPFWPVAVALIATIKAFVFLVDPLPMFFLGDSASYLHTALSGWIPPDRSFLYGYFIRLVAVSSASLSALVFAQVLVSGVSAWLVVYLCFSVIKLNALSSLGAGLLVAADPLQLLYERYVLTETVSLMVYTLIICFSCVYLRKSSLPPLALLAVLAALLVAFRVSFLVVVTGAALLLCLLPLLAGRTERPRGETKLPQRWKRGLLQATFFFALTLLLQAGYKRLNGRLSGSPPAFQSRGGLHLAAVWAPILRVDAAPNAEVAAVLSRGADYRLRDKRARGLQLFGGDHYLIGRLRALKPPDLNALCRRLAISSAVRDPLGVTKLALQTLAEYFDPAYVSSSMRRERGDNRALSQDIREVLATRFHLAGGELYRHQTFTKKYHEACKFYYPLLLFTPLVALAAVILTRERRVYALLILMHAALVIATIGLFAGAVVRYLHPLTPLFAISLALLTAGLIERKLKPSATASSGESQASGGSHE